MKSFNHPVMRFLAVGGANTLIGYTLYLLLNLFVDYRLAYALSYAVGIVASFVLNSVYVFRQPLRWARLAAYPLVYLVQFLLGFALVWCFVAVLHWPEAYAPIAALALGVPVSYWLTRVVITDR